jgi:hypothetical protein
MYYKNNPLINKKGLGIVILNASFGDDFEGFCYISPLQYLIREHKTRSHGP